MAIRDKEGNIYVLQGPNPIMDKQSPWDKSKIILINMKCDSCVTFEDVNSMRRLVREKVFNIGDLLPETHPISATEFVDEIKATPIVVPEPPKKKIVKFYCAPAKMEKRSLPNGKTTSRIVYEDKFIFEGVIMTLEDLVMRFWTNIDLQENTIVYPQIMDKRWWKVKGREKMEDGHLYATIPSDMTPDFS